MTGPAGGRHSESPGNGFYGDPEGRPIQQNTGQYGRVLVGHGWATESGSGPRRRAANPSPLTWSAGRFTGSTRTVTVNAWSTLPTVSGVTRWPVPS